MSSPYRKALRGAYLVVAMLGAVLMRCATAAPLLKVCVDQANPTWTMDARVVRASAKTQHYGVQLVKFVGLGKGGDGFPVNRFAKLASSECQLVMGFPVDVTNPSLPPDVVATLPYASTGFVMVQRIQAPSSSLSELPKGSEVGIAQLDTYAGLLYSAHPNIVMHVYPKDSLMLADLATEHITAGLAWQPTIERYIHDRAKPPLFDIRIVPEKHMRWNLVALYMPSSQRAAELFAEGLAELKNKGQLERLLEPYQVVATTAGGRIAPTVADFKPTSGVIHNSATQDLIKVSNTTTPSAPKHKRPPALYAGAQAEKGAIAYFQNCAMCHGPLMEGQAGGYAGPALKGEDFADASYDFHVSDIFNFVAKLMPPSAPGSLTREQDVLIMAYILQQNGYPAGTHALIYEEAEKSKVPLRYHGK